MKVEVAVLLGNGTVSVGNRFPTKASGSSIETSDVTQHHIPEERNPQTHPASYKESLKVLGFRLLGLLINVILQ